MTTSEVLSKANATYNRIFQDITEPDGTYNTGILAAYIGALFDIAFANIEKECGLKVARNSFKYVADFFHDVMIDGAYDPINDKIK